MSTAQVRELALGLPSQDRASLARELIESLEAEEPADDIEAAWTEEIESRAEALDQGNARADDWKTSLERVRHQLREGRSP